MNNIMNLDIVNNKLKGADIKEKRKNLGEKEFKSRYVGNYKNHIRKLKSVFNSLNTGKTKFNDQAYPGMMEYDKKK